MLTKFDFGNVVRRLWLTASAFVCDDAIYIGQNTVRAQVNRYQQ